MILQETSTIIIAIDTETPCLQWISKGGIMTSEEFRNSHYSLIENFKKQKQIHPKLTLLVDCRKMGVISPANVEWASQTTLPKIAALGCSKQAIIVPSDVFGKMAVDIFDRKRDKDKLLTMYFDSLENARNWLKE